MSEPSAPPSIDHAGAEILTPDECHELLVVAPVGRIAFVHDGDVTILPVNIGMWNQSIVFSTLPGSKLDAAVMTEQVSIEVDGWNATTHEGWSVLAKGTAMEITDAEEIATVERLHVEPWVESDEVRQWVRVLPNEVTGRRVRQTH